MSQTAAKRLQDEGDYIDYTPSSAVTGGDVVVIGSMPLIATGDIAANKLGALAIEGVFGVPKDTSTFTAGDAVYWATAGSPVTGTASSGAATSTASGNYLMGFAIADAATSVDTVKVLLTTAKRTATIAGSVTADDITGSDSSLGIAGQAAAQGGAIALVGGTSSTSGNAGGAITNVGGTPGATGVGGAWSATGGAGGSSSGAGGAVSMTGGAATASNSAGGAASVTGGVGAGSSAGGAFAAAGGASAASSSGAGGAASLTGGAVGTSGTGTGGLASVTGGAGRSGGTAGGASMDAGAANSGTAGNTIISDVNAGATYLNRGPLKALQVGLTLTALGTVQSSTPTSAQLLGGLLTQTGATGAGTVTLPTGTALSTACARTPVAGDTFDVLFANLGGSQTLTITGATGTTVIGTAAVGSGKMSTMKFYNVSANTWNIYVNVSA